MSKKSTKLSALQDMFQENRISSDKVELSDSVIIEMKKKEDAVPDYRHPSYTRHLLGDIIYDYFLRFTGQCK